MGPISPRRSASWPRTSAARAALAEAEVGDPQAALQAIAAATRGDRGPDLLAATARARERLGDRAGAALAYAQWRELVPDGSAAAALAEARMREQWRGLDATALEEAARKAAGTAARAVPARARGSKRARGGTGRGSAVARSPVRAGRRGSGCSCRAPASSPGSPTCSWRPRPRRCACSPGRPAATCRSPGRTPARAPPRPSRRRPPLASGPRCWSAWSAPATSRPPPRSPPPAAAGPAGRPGRGCRRKSSGWHRRSRPAPPRSRQAVGRANRTTAVILAPDNAYGNAPWPPSRSHFQKMGGSLWKSPTYPPNTTSFSKVLEPVRSSLKSAAVLDPRPARAGGAGGAADGPRRCRHRSAQAARRAGAVDRRGLLAGGDRAGHEVLEAS